ncbi:MAG: heavy metal-binding protein [Haloplasmataceae bacterium]|jgi:copper ion binding protein|nr:heavy metal-binding protein [Haloplasmataceae bacterium]
MTTFQLETLTCPSCVTKIEKTIKKLNGINHVEVLFNASKVKVDFDEINITSADISKVIKRLGYEVLSQK